MPCTSHQPELRWSNKGKQPSWTLNYTVLSFLLNGHNYVQYSNIIGMMGLQVVTKQMEHNNFHHWTPLHHMLTHLLLSLANRYGITSLPEEIKLSWKVSFDGFYLTRGHHSNNSTATLHDISTLRQSEQGVEQQE